MSRLPARPGRPSRGVRLRRTCLIDGDHPPLFSATGPCPSGAEGRRGWRALEGSRGFLEGLKEGVKCFTSGSPPFNPRLVHPFSRVAIGMHANFGAAVHFDRPPGPPTASLARRDGINFVLLSLAYTWPALRCSSLGKDPNSSSPSSTPNSMPTF